MSIGDTTVNLLPKIPLNILNKINYYKSKGLESEQFIEVVIISGESVDNVNKTVENLGGTFENLGYGFGIAKIPVDKLPDLISSEIIQYIELPKSLYLSDSASNRAACVQNAQDVYKLTGKGVLVGFIDSGIDYTHPAFKNIDNTTRIEYIYDLNAGGVVYDKAKINEALKSTDPFSIVPSEDRSDHGTHVAGIACAGGNIPKELYGVAPESSIIMVKCVIGLYSLSTNIMRGLKFLVDKSKELKKPLVVNISLSTNDGAHNGTSLLEQYIFTVANLERITIAIAAGNEGDAAHHVGGELKDEQIVELNIAEDEMSVTVNFYKSILPELTIEVINPIGISTGEVFIQEEYLQKNVSSDSVLFLIRGANPFDVLGDISITIVASNEYIISGIWKFVIRVKNKIYGRYDGWLPISEGLNTKTKFVKPDLYNTLGIPGTVNNVITIGSYNYVNNTISSFSGRGKEFEKENVKPELVAPGEGIKSSIPNKSFDKKSGTSMATPHVTGIIALLSQWGIVKGNDPYLYGERMKYFLIKGSKRDRTDITYPNASWGYGEVCAFNSLSVLSNLARRDTKYEEYKINKLLIRYPNS